MSSTLVDTKNLLAKLLATENITIVHSHCKTATFNMKTRTLTCPIWKDMDGDIYDMLMGHEVSHALHTPLQGWHDNLVDNKSFKSFLNIIEDARIEKLIKIKYPGLRKSFSNAYKSLFDKDHFGIKRLNGNYNQMNLIDRINLHAKMGHLALVKFDEAEQPFVDRLDGLETFEDALQLAKDVQAYCKEYEQDKINSTEELQDAIDEALEQARKENEKQSEADEPKNDQADEPKNDQADEPIDGQSPEAAEGDSEESDEGEGKSPSTDSDEESDEADEGQFGEGDEGEGDQSDGQESNSNEEADEGDEKEGKLASGVDDEDSSEEGSECQNSEEGDEEEGNEQASGGNESDEESDEEGEDTDEAGNSDEGGTSQEAIERNEPKSLTDEAFRAHESDLVDSTADEIVIYDMPACDIKKVIVPYKVVTKAFIDGLTPKMEYSYPPLRYEEVAATCVAMFYAENKNHISTLVSEFDRLKNASQYVRQLTAKSGELDTHKLAKYRFSSDVFKKVTTTTKGKSHGMVLFLDMSSSMAKIFPEVIEQLMILVTFCKRTGTPFDVYGFADTPQYDEKYIDGISDIAIGNAIGIKDGPKFHLKHLASSEMSEQDYKKAFGMLATISKLHTRTRYLKDNRKSINRRFTGLNNLNFDLTACHMYLSGTPFSEMLVASREIIERFKQRTQCDIVNVVHLTDGNGHNNFDFPGVGTTYYWTTPFKVPTKVGIVDPKTKKRVIGSNDNNIQRVLTELVGELTGCRHIGFYLSDEKRALMTAAGFDYYTGDKPTEKALADNGFFEKPSRGYDNYFYVKAKYDAGAEGTDLLQNFKKGTAQVRAEKLIARQFAALIADHVDR